MSKYPRRFSSNAHDASVRSSVNALMSDMNMESDAAYKSFYEKQYSKYGGDVEALPWRRNTRLT